MRLTLACRQPRCFKFERVLNSFGQAASPERWLQQTMLENLDKIKQELKSSDLEIRIHAIESIVVHINSLTELLLDSFEHNSNRFVTTERLSLVFYTYIEKLNGYLSGDNMELKFWAATLIVHYNIRTKQAEDILINEAKIGSPGEAYVATTILCRTKNDRILETIRQRLKTGDFPDNVMRDFFLEKLNDSGTFSI